MDEQQQQQQQHSTFRPGVVNSFQQPARPPLGGTGVARGARGRGVARGSGAIDGVDRDDERADGAVSQPVGDRPDDQVETGERIEKFEF